MCDNDIKGYQARSFKTHSKNTVNVEKNEFMSDIQFTQNGGKSIKKFERKQKIKDIKDQIDYFGYEIEPFHMKDERDIGNFDGGGFFVFDKNKDKTINDAWLDSLDQGNTFDKMKQDLNVPKSKLDLIDQLADGFEKETKQFGNHSGNEYFKSSRFSTKQEADEYYRNLDDLEQGNQDHQENEKEESISENEEDLEITEEKNKQVKPKKATKKESFHPDLNQFDADQLKTILIDLLEDGENPNEAMKRLKEIFAPTQQKQQFKKNQRKQVRFEEPALQQAEINEGQKVEARQTFDMILDLCQTILTKTEDPGIYELRKDRIIPQEPHDNMNDSTRYQTKVASISDLHEIINPDVIIDEEPNFQIVQVEEGVVYDEKDEDNIF